MANKQAPHTEVPPGLRVQLSRLFGPNSWEVKNESRTSTEWKRTMRRILVELDRYLSENVQTDEVQLLMLYSGLAAAHESLKQTYFWPGYVEGIVRFALLLMGDYPDHRRRIGKAKSKNYYKLNRCRSLHYTQTKNQKYWTLLSAEGLRAPPLSKSPRDALSEFRQEYGYKRSFNDFFKWYRANYPKDYAAIF